MAFYKSKYTGTEIDQRLTQATYDDAVLAGFEGSKEEFDAILGKLKEIADKVENSIQIESENLETFNKNVVNAINELHRELQAKPDEQDVIDQGELDVFKDEIAAKYATKGEIEELVDSDKLLSGAGINIREEDGKKIVSVADDTLAKIQYSDSEVRRLETAKIPYAYDEKTQSNINVILPEGGSYLGNYGNENATVAKAAVYDGTKQLEIGSSKVHTNINTDSDVTIETSDGKKVIATTDQIPDVSNFVTKEEVPSVFETKGLTELETGESSANIEAALGIDFTSLIEIIRENKTIIIDRNSAGDYKACIHATGNISGGNGAANLMFFIGTTPTIYQVQYVNGTFALAVDEYEFAKKSEIPDISNLATKEEITSKVDWIDYNDTKNIVLPSNGQIFGDFGGEESNSSLLGARIYNAGLENEEKQVEVGTSKVHLNLNSLDKPTIETPDGKESLVVESDIELIPKEIRIPIRTLQDKVYTQEEILDWFGVEDIVSLKKIIVYGGIQYVKYGLSLSTNPHYYKMPVEYVAFESANQIKLVFVGLNTRDDVASKYEMTMNLDGTIIEGNSNVKMTVTSIEPKDIDLSTYATKEELNDYALKSEIPDISNLATVATSGNYNDLTNTPNLTVYQTISDDSLTTSAKTIPAAINEVKNSVDQIQAPYEINLTNLLAAEDSESISTVIGGIDNLNNTVQDNRIIVGTISNGSVSVSIRILGNVTTLYYLLDSVVGLTLNEVAITNTSGTLSKSVTTHSVLTENMVINSLESNEATLPLSAAQGKVLNSDKQNKTDETLQTTDKTVAGAINELLAKVQELETKNTELESRLAALEETN